MKEKKQQESKTKYQQALKKLRESRLQVEDMEDRTEDGSTFGFVGGVSVQFIQRTASVTIRYAAARNESIVTALERFDVTGIDTTYSAMTKIAAHRGYRRLNSDTVLVYRQHTTGNTTRRTTA
jgi:hypothetical protein